MNFGEFSKNCEHKITLDCIRRSANALCIEWFPHNATRCKLLVPDHWGNMMSAARWLLSGGDATVFGVCASYNCPRVRDKRG